MKRIVLEIETDSAGGKKGRIQVQTHRCADFGDSGSAHFYASNGFKISSESHPEAYSSPSLLCARGNSSSDDSRVFRIPGGWLGACSVAIREYNLKFADEGVVMEVLS